METQTFWSTKYLFTRGIVQEDGCLEARGYATRDTGQAFSSPRYLFQKVGLVAFPTLELAEARASIMVATKLRSVEKERQALLTLQRKLDSAHTRRQQSND